MKYLICLPIVLFLSAFYKHVEVGKLPANCVVVFCKPKSTLAIGKAEVEFTFANDQGRKITDSIQFSYNGINKTLFPDKAGKANLVLPCGQYKFQFYLNSIYYEVYSDTILLKEKCLTGISVNFQNASVPTVTKKPVLYLYPQATTEVNVKLAVKGVLGFTYPSYSATAGWNVTADPNGTLHIGEKQFDYLFWDANVQVNMNTTDLTTGFIVEKDSLTPFLEHQLTEMKLSPREQQDFITFWVPLMMKNEKTFVHFLFNEDCDSMAELNINPQPDHIFRVQMLWADSELVNAQTINAQKIESIERDGFSVVEWGGAEINTNAQQITIK